MDAVTLASACRSAGFVLFDSETWRNPAGCAETNLSGRTHYVDPDTRRFFAARILKCSAIHDGLILGIIESVSADPWNSRRVFRPVFFNLNGEVLARPNIDAAFSTRRAAEREFWRIANDMDACAETLRMLGNMATRREREAAEYRAIIEGGEQ